MVTPVRSCWSASGIEYIDVRTVGAQHIWVTDSLSISLYTSSGSTLRRQILVAPTAVVAHVKHQPLQWNIGKVQRYFDS